MGARNRSVGRVTGQTSAEPDIDALIVEVGRRRVILDTDLARIYGVPTKALNQAVKRNKARFPEDFLFRFTAEEVEELNRSQTVTGSQRHRDPRFRPFAFTEHGAIMAASVLNSPRAVAMSVYVVRAFVKMREDLAANAAILKRLAEIDKTLLIHDSALAVRAGQIAANLVPERAKVEGRRKPIGFRLV